MKNVMLALWILVVVSPSCKTEPNEKISSKAEAVETTAWQSPDKAYGELFEAVQLAAIFPDSKTFVDCTPKRPRQEIRSNYEEAKLLEDFDLEAFVLKYFDLPKQYATNFQSDTTRSVEAHIKMLWDYLKREADQSASGSLISLPNAYIVPGGRFGEIYYWDSYFTMLGLQESGQTVLIENMLQNFAYLIDTVGHIPNGNRTYYLSRSQPPFFAAMVNLLTETQGVETLQRFLPALEQEYKFWMAGEEKLQTVHRRLVRLDSATVLNRYCDDEAIPRQESYKEDIKVAVESGRDKPLIYNHIRSGAESGWDFSSRWFADARNLYTIETTDIIPVDLNALLYNLELTISEAYGVVGNENMARQYNDRAMARKAAIQTFCWDSESGIYRDYNFKKHIFTPVPSLAMMYPLFFNIANQDQADAVAAVIQQDFLKAGGVVTTLNNTGEQWDAPNGWAPLQWITIQGLRNYGYDDLAATIASRWIDLNIKVYKNTGKMVEKYNVMDMSLDAGGGEYPVQDGFGWSNGVLLKLISIYGK